MTRHHAESNNILLTRNLPFDSDFRQRSHSLMIPLPCSWAKSNRMHGQFEYDVTWFCFCFILFVRMHGAVVVPQFVSQGEGSGGESWGEGLENYTVFMDVICVSSLTCYLSLAYSSSYNLTPPISRVLISRQLIFYLPT